MYDICPIINRFSHMFFIMILWIVFVIPECSPELKPVVGQKFQTLDFGFAFYDVYARAVGFGTL